MGFEEYSANGRQKRRRDEKSGRKKTRLPDLSQLLYFQGNRGARDRNWKWGVMEGPCTSDWGKRGEMKGSDHDP